MAEPAPHCFTEDRVEGRPQRQRQPEVVGGERQREGDDREHRPRMHAPVEDGGGDGELNRGGGIGRIDAERRIPEVVDRLGNSEEHQADTDAGREQHGEPRPGGVVGSGVRTAEADAAERRHPQQQQKRTKMLPAPRNTQSNVEVSQA